jgi:hypothetical protein
MAMVGRLRRSDRTDLWCWVGHSVEQASTRTPNLSRVKVGNSCGQKARDRNREMGSKPYAEVITTNLQFLEVQNHPKKWFFKLFVRFSTLIYGKLFEAA